MKRRNRVKKVVWASFLTSAILFCAGSAPLLAVDSLNMGSISANAGTTGVGVMVSGTNDQAIQGFSIAATFVAGVLACTDVSVTGTEVEVVSPGGSPEYFGITIDNIGGTVIAGMIFAINPAGGTLPEIPISPTTANDLLRLVFDVDPAATPGDFPLDLVNGIGNPPVNNTYSANGQSILPELTSGLFTVNNQHVFTMDSTLTAPGSLTIPLLRYSHQEEIAGFVASLTYDSSLLSLIDPPSVSDWYSGLDLDFHLAPNIVEFFLVTLDIFPPNTGWVAIAAQFDFAPPFDGQTLGVGTDQTILRFQFNTVGNPALIGTCTPLTLSNGIGSPPIDNLVVLPNGTGILPGLVDGEVCFADLPLFSRGNANQDPVLDLADAIFIINFLFVSGTPPACRDAADANDDGLLDISDAITVISYLFSSGGAPPAPFPGCGPDPTSDALDCATPQPVCP